MPNKGVEQPSTPELCEGVAALKEDSTYIESAIVTRARERDFQEQIDFAARTTCEGAQTER